MIPSKESLSQDLLITWYNALIRSGGWRAAAGCAYWKKGSKSNYYGMLLEYVFLISDTIKFLVYFNVYVALYKGRSCHAKRRCLDRFVTLGNANKEDYRPLKE